jgi:hypothetical protein
MNLNTRYPLPTNLHSWVSGYPLSICDTNSNDGMCSAAHLMTSSTRWMDPWMGFWVLLQLNEHITVNVSYWSACCVSFHTAILLLLLTYCYLSTYLPIYILSLVLLLSHKALPNQAFIPSKLKRPPKWTCHKEIQCQAKERDAILFHVTKFVGMEIKVEESQWVF